MELLNLYGYLSVLLRALTLAFQSLVIGGVIFTHLVIRPSPEPDKGKIVFRSGLRLMTISAIGLILAQAAAIVINAITLRQTTGLRFAQLGSATFVTAGALIIAGAAGLAALSSKPALRPAAVLIAPSLAILAGSLLTSHALARMQERVLPAAATVLHQAATAAWMGGLPYFLLAVSRSPDTGITERVGQRFSRLAIVSVIVLICAGITLSFCYIKSPQALYGTAYGVMTMSKAVLFAALLALGATNRLLIRELRSNPQELTRKLQCFTEAEIGIGFTVILAAASLTSQPPAVDFIANRVTGQEIIERLAPKLPQLSTPAHDAISPSTRQEAKAAGVATEFIPVELPNTPADIAWSEYNHHWAGLIVLGIGLLAMAHRSGFAPWARHWPLLFLGLGAFILLRADPEGWPLGPDGFFEGMTNAEVLQHRLAVLFVVAFGIFEWRVRTGLAKSRLPAFIFPAVCAAGGAVLLTHTHALGNIKEELLAEISHLTIAVLAVAAGWTRWLELRLPNGNRGIVSWIWPVCFALIGAVLLDYREA